eukprot:11254554-Prorocentrum_lima.AAC.1
MTSSLVGSEMCIRDRFWKKGSNQMMLETAGIDTTKTIVPINMWRKRSRDCLLYTSDAADDM